MIEGETEFPVEAEVKMEEMFSLSPADDDDSFGEESDPQSLKSHDLKDNPISTISKRPPLPTRAMADIDSFCWEGDPSLSSVRPPPLPGREMPERMLDAEEFTATLDPESLQDTVEDFLYSTSGETINSIEKTDPLVQEEKKKANTRMEIENIFQQGH